MTLIRTLPSFGGIYRLRPVACEGEIEGNEDGTNAQRGIFCISRTRRFAVLARYEITVERDRKVDI